MVTYHTGNILDSKAEIICHQVNCMGAMNSGVAKAIRQKYPKVFSEYIDMYETYPENPLGHIQVIYIDDNRSVINMFAQNGYGYDGRRYTSYDAFWSCLGEIREHISPSKTLAFPFKIGCVRGGANWEVIATMIEEVLGDDFNIEFWEYKE